MEIKFGTITPKSLNVSAYRRGVETALRLEGNTIEALYKGVSDGFSEPAAYRKRLSKTGRRWEMKVSTRDKRMIFLDKGTKTRWAVMSSDFKPKTQKRKLRSRRGSGGPIIRGRSAMQARNIAPRPGVEAREFSEEIVDQRKNKFPERVQNAIDLAARNTWSGKIIRIIT
jgi:hypothetical protein